MTDSPGEPDWSLLPHDPVRFFGLAEGFDRRELKRSYNQLIRRFKPEKHPQEFQRIRAAYEQLDSGIRYGLGVQFSADSPGEYRWSDDVQNRSSGRDAASATPSTADPAPAARPLHERLASESVTGIYRELVAKTAKTPFDYYSLAVMSDVVDRTDRFQFARWLLEGIATHGNEIGLLRLLHSYVRGPIEETEREKLLIACSKAVHETVFFALTEPLWRGLLGCGSFARFESTLRQCEANLKGLSIDGRLAFYLQMLKPAIWVADEAWVAESMNFIERNFERIPPFLEYDLEMVARLSEYRKHRAVFAEGHPLLQKLDRGLRDYFSEEQQVGDRSIVECQVQILTNKEALGAAFDQAGNPAYGAFLAIWAWISHDVAERNTDPAEQSIDEELWYGRTQTLLTQLAQQTRSSKFGMRWGVATVTYRVSQVLCYLCIPLFLAVSFSIFMPLIANRKRG